MDLEGLRRRVEALLAEDPRVRRWRVRTDGAIALEIIAQGAVPPQDRYQIVEALGKPLYRIDRPEGALDALLADLILVRVDVDGLQPPEWVPEADPAERLQVLNHQFWVDLWVAYGFLQRGKPWKAIKQLADIREILFEVGRIAADEPKQRDEEVIPEALQPFLASTSCAPEPALVGQALLHAIHVYRNLRAEACKGPGLTIDVGREQDLIAHLTDVFGDATA